MPTPPKTNSVIRRLLIQVVAFYIGFALILLAIDFTLQYRTVKRELSEELRLIHRSFSPGLGQALWDINTSQVESFFAGMLSLPSVVGGEIRDETGKTICIAGTVREEDGTIVHFEGKERRLIQSSWSDIFSHGEDIVFDDGTDAQIVGKAVIYSSSGIVLQRLVLGVKLTLIKVCISAAALCLIFALLFKKHLGRPLGQLTAAVENLDPDDIGNFDLHIETADRNELKVLEESFNQMAQNLARDKNALLGFRDDLERQIEQRTAELREKADTDASIASLTSSLQGELDSDQIATTALQLIIENTNAAAGALYVLEKNDSLRRRAEHALPPEAEAASQFQLGSGSVGQAGKSGKLLIQSHGEGKPLFTFGLGKVAPHQIITCPLTTGDNLAGVVELYLLKDFTDSEKNWLGKSAKIIAATLQLSQQRAEKERADDHIRLILESTPDCMIISNDRGEIDFANSIATSTFGYTREELIGRPVTDLMPQRYRHGHDDYLTNFTANPHVREMGSGLDLYAVKSDGTEFPVQISLSPIQTDESLFIVAALRDVAQLKAEQIHMRKLSRATEQSPALVVITDREGLIEYVNPKFTEVTGYTPEEVIGQTTRLLNSGKQTPSFYKRLWDTILAGEEWHGAFCNLKKNGDEYWERASISPIRDDSGEVSHFVAVKENITELEARRTLARQKKASREKGEGKSEDV